MITRDYLIGGDAYDPPKSFQRLADVGPRVACAVNVRVYTRPLLLYTYVTHTVVPRYIKGHFCSKIPDRHDVSCLKNDLFVRTCIRVRARHEIPSHWP